MSILDFRPILGMRGQRGGLQVELCLKEMLLSSLHVVDIPMVSLSFREVDLGG